MKAIHGIFISKPSFGHIYIAERSRKGSNKLIWSIMPEHSGSDVKTNARRVPFQIRREAYRWLSQ